MKLSIQGCTKFFSTTSNDYFYFKKNKPRSNNNFITSTSQKSVGNCDKDRF
jgi:hypothetical protein